MRSSSSASALFSKISAPRPPSVHELKRRRSSAEPDAAAIGTYDNFTTRKLD